MPPTANLAPAGPARGRIVLAHDWLCGYRGGEAVLDRIALLAAARHDCETLLTMVDDGRPMTPAIDSLRHVTSMLQRLPLAPGSLRRWYLPLYPRAVGDLSRRLADEHRHRPIDLSISTSSAAIKGISPPTGVPHLCYCHSPARYVWSQADEYRRGQGLTARLRRLGLDRVRKRFSEWDRRTAANVTRFVVNSSHTCSEVLRCYGRSSEVVYPPVRTGFYSPDPAMMRGGFWLVVSALEPYKRIDLAIDAANAVGTPLVIAGAGSQRRELERGAGPSVRFLGRVSDEKLRELYRTAALLLFPQVEDFGIVAAEAQACGLPVVARRAGGALDIVRDGVTGAFFESATPQSLIEAIQRAPRACSVACRENAERFSESAFDAAMSRHIDELLDARS